TLEALQPEYGKAWVLSMLAEAFVRLDDTEAARRTAAALAPFAGTNVVAGAGVLYGGAVDHHLGVLHLAAGERHPGHAHLRAALDMHQRLGATTWTARPADALASVAPDTPTASAADNAMTRDGDVWTVTYSAKTFSVKDSKGLRDLAVLLANPGVDVSAAV